jgi:subtilisin family serine protease
MTVDATALGQLLADPEVTSISEDGVIFPLLVDTVSLTRANNAWAEGFRGVGQTVAVIDTGLDSAHPFFAGKVVAEACFSNPGSGSTTLCPNGQPQQIGPGAGINCSDVNMGCWHGTHVAGIAVGNHGHLTPDTGGIGSGASVMPIQVFQVDCSSGTCQLSAYYSDIMQSLEYVYSLRNSYTIAAANLSLGGANFSNTCDYEAPGVTSVIQSLRAANIATVIAAGNSGMADAISFPGCISEAISVGSTTKQSTISTFSNSASFLNVLAPGSSIQSSLPGGGYGYTSGTSMAAPHVAGAWATLKSAKPSATVTEVLSALTSSGMAITDPRNGIAKPLIQIGDTMSSLGALGVLLGRGASPGTEIIMDNAAAGVSDAPGGREFTGSWCTASPWNQFGADALSSCAGATYATYRWIPTLPTAGSWDVYVWWSAQSYQSSSAVVKVVSADGPVTRTFDQTTGGGQWVLHGRYGFNAGATGYVEVNNGLGRVSADAVRFVPAGAALPLPVVTITARDALAGEAPLHTGELIVARTGSTGAALTVQYGVDGTAAPGADYVTLSGAITIPAGASSVSLTITPLDDGLVEPKETVIVTLTAASGYTVGTNSMAKVTITSEDTAEAPVLRQGVERSGGALRPWRPYVGGVSRSTKP